MAIQATLDSGRVLYAFRKAPEVFAEEIDHWFNKERLSFLGARKAAISGIKGKLLHKERWGRSGGWSPSIVGQFISSKNHPGQLEASMSMGFAPGSPLESAMELEEKGGRIQSDKFMPIPVWGNLQKIGITKASFKAFEEMSSGNELYSIPGKNGKIYWLSKIFGSGEKGQGLLLFIGSKAIKVKKQFNFHKAWDNRYPKIMRRGDMSIFRATRKVEKMMSEGILV